ncbi:MAG: TolC family protein [Chromatiales bacterium]
MSYQGVFTFVVVLITNLPGGASLRAETLAPPEIGTATCPETTSAESQAHEVITLRRALQLALAGNPDLAVFSCEIKAVEGRALQAGLRPNPAVGLEVENFAGGRAHSGFESAETTLGVSQLIALGGKRAKRARVVGLERDIVLWDREAGRLDLITETRQSFVAVLAAQERRALFAELAKLAEEVQRTVKQRVQAGKVSPVEETRIQVPVSRARLDITRADSELAAARQRLAAAWGAERATFERVDANLEEVSPLPPLAEVEAAVTRNPDLARWASEMELRRGNLDLAQTQRIPDVTVNGGVRQFAETDDVALVVGLSVPLPLFNRNQGAVQEAQSRLTAADLEQRATRLKLLSAVNERYQALAAANAEVAVLGEQVLPVAQRTFEATTVGYREGKFGYLEVLDAQRTLFEARGQFLDALARYHTATAELERLIGVGVDELDGVQADQARTSQELRSQQ